MSEFVLMPKSPSEAILQIDGYPRVAFDQYQKMLAAAPAAPVAAQDELVAEMLTALQACVVVMASDLPPSAATAELAQAQAAIDKATGRPA